MNCSVLFVCVFRTRIANDAAFLQGVPTNAFPTVCVLKTTGAVATIGIATAAGMCQPIN
jgi:hypothetical protein